MNVERLPCAAEHYYGSFLAAQNLSHETDCIGAITLANFTNSVRVMLQLP